MAYPPIPEISLADLGKRLRARLGTQRVPLMGSIELTARCNLRCVHCYINLPARDDAARQGELRGRDWGPIIDEIAAAGCLKLLITGGEPLLHPEFREIYTHAKKAGLLLTLFTNGTLITPAVADYLAAWRPLSIEITIYGSTPQTYAAVTQVEGAFEQCRRGIRLLLERGLPLTLKTMIMTLNQHELRDMKTLAEDLGVKFRYDPVLAPRLDGSQEPCNFRLSPEEVVALDLADEKRVQEWREYFANFRKKPDPDEVFHCGAGLNGFHINPYGELSVCLEARNPGYGLSDGTFTQGWEDFLPQVRGQKRQSPNPCGECEFISSCPQCPGWAALEAGDREARVEYLCRITQLRVAVFSADRSLEIKGKK